MDRVSKALAKTIVHSAERDLIRNSSGVLAIFSTKTSIPEGNLITTHKHFYVVNNSSNFDILIEESQEGVKNGTRDEFTHKLSRKLSRNEEYPDDYLLLFTLPNNALGDIFCYVWEIVNGTIKPARRLEEIPITESSFSLPGTVFLNNRFFDDDRFSIQGVESSLLEAVKRRVKEIFSELPNGEHQLLGPDGSSYFFAFEIGDKQNNVDNLIEDLSRTAARYTSSGKESEFQLRFYSTPLVFTSTKYRINTSGWVEQIS